MQKTKAFKDVTLKNQFTLLRDVNKVECWYSARCSIPNKIKLQLEGHNWVKPIHFTLLKRFSRFLFILSFLSASPAT